MPSYSKYDCSIAIRKCTAARQVGVRLAIYFVIFRMQFLFRFLEHKAKHGSTLAYHGSAFENMHSIVNNGLQGHLNKVDAGNCFSASFLFCGRINMNMNGYITASWPGPD